MDIGNKSLLGTQANIPFKSLLFFKYERLGKGLVALKGKHSLVALETLTISPGTRRSLNLVLFYRWGEEAWKGLDWTADHRRFKPNLFLMRDIIVNYQLLTVPVLLEVLRAASAEDLAMWYQKAESICQTQRGKELDAMSNLQAPKVVRTGSPLCILPKARKGRMELRRFWLVDLDLAIEPSHLLSLEKAGLSLESLVKCLVD